MANPFLKMHIFKRKFPFKSIKAFQKVTFQTFSQNPLSSKIILNLKKVLASSFTKVWKPLFLVSFKWVLNLSLSQDVIRFKTYLRQISLKRFFLKQPSCITFFKMIKNHGFLNGKLPFSKENPWKPSSLTQSFSHVSIRVSKTFFQTNCCFLCFNLYYK